MCVVVVITLVVRTSGFEVALNRRAEFDAEFRAHGIAGIVTGLLGGTACAAAPGTTKLMADMGSKSSLASFVVAAVVLLFLVAGVDLTAYFAMPLLGGLLFVVGWALTSSAVLPPIRQKSWTDLAIIVLIVAVAMRAGFFSALVTGFAVSCLMFAVSYSRIGVIRRHLTRAS